MSEQLQWEEDLDYRKNSKHEADSCVLDQGKPLRWRVTQSHTYNKISWYIEDSDEELGPSHFNEEFDSADTAKSKCQRLEDGIIHLRTAWKEKVAKGSLYWKSSKGLYGNTQYEAESSIPDRDGCRIGWRVHQWLSKDKVAWRVGCLNQEYPTHEAAMAFCQADEDKIVAAAKAMEEK